MKRLLRWPQLWGALIFFALTPNMVDAQCINIYQFPSTIITIDQTTTTPLTISTCNYTEEYYVVNVNFPGIYTFSVSSIPGYVTITDASNNVVSHGPSPHQVAIPGTGQYRAHWSDNASCGASTICYTTTAVFTTFLGGCIPPLGITATGITSNSANISFTASSSNPANGYEYVITPTAGTPTGAGTPITGTTFPAGGLTPNTQYFVYVRAMCASDTSLWNQTSFFTTCVAVTAPWTENFDGPAWVPSVTIDQCWTANPTSGYRWQVNTGTTSSLSTGPSGDHTTGTSNYLYTEASSGAPGDVAELITPLVDISGVTNPALRFWKHFYGAEIDSFSVSVDAGSGWVTIYSTVGDGPQTSVTDPWVEEVLDLSSFTGSTGLQVRFRAVSAGCCGGDMAIDDVAINQGPPCFKPSSISVVSTGITDVTLDWIPGTGVSWEVAYGAPGFDPTLAVGVTNGPIAIVTAGVHPFQVTGLTTSTEYQFYVREACVNVPGTNSAWRGPAATRTNCTAFTAPFSENFDDSTWVWGTTTGDIDPCWSRNAVPTGQFSWMVDDDNTSTSNGPSQDHTTGLGQFITTESYGSVGDIAEITSPIVDLTGLTNPSVGFYFHMFGDDMGTLRIQVDAGSGFVTIGTIGGQYQTAETDPWLYHEESLAAYAGQQIQVRFSTTRPATCCDFDIAIDDFFIGNGSPCAIPGFPTVTPLSDTQLDVTWTDVSNVAWNVVWGPPGFSPDSAVGATNGPIGTQLAFTTNHTIVGLNPNTTYQVYVNAFCATGGVSYWSGPLSGTTLCGTETQPWSYDFENGQWNFAIQYDQCWGGAVAPLTIGYRWQAEVDATPSGVTGPSSDHTTGTPGAGTYVYVESSSPSPSSARLESPVIDLTGATTPAVAFYFHAYGAQINKTYIEVNGGSGWVILDSIVGQFQSSVADPWLYYEVSLLAYAGQTVQIGWNAQSIGSCCAGDFAIDDIFVGNGSPCPLPTQLGFINGTTTTIDLGWLGAGTSNSWEIAYGPVGFNPDSSVGSPNGPIGIAGPFTNDTATVTGLAPSTVYQFFVRENCGTPGVNSFWAGPVVGQTDCQPVPAPWSDSFESGISQCWIQDPNNDVDFQQWSGGTASFDTGPTGANDGTYYIYPETSGTTVGDKARITSPEVDISTITNPTLIMDYHMYGAGMGWFNVMVDSANTGNIDTLFSIYGDQGNQWNQLVLSLAGYEDPTTNAISVILELTVDNANGFAFENDLAFDHVRIEQGPACFGPAFMSATATSSSSVDVSFNPVNPSASSWEVEYGPAGYQAGTGTSVTVTSPTATITGLSTGTCYEFHVREECGTPGTYSLWSAAANSCTFIVPPYFESFTVNYEDAGYGEAKGLIGEPTVFSSSTSNWTDDGFGNVGFEGSAKLNIWNIFNYEWTFTPVIELNSFGQWQLEFDWTCRQFASAFAAPLWGWDDTVYVVISTDAGLTWNRTNALLMLDSATVVSAGTDTIHEVIDISMYGGYSVQIGFYGESTVSNEDTDFFIDNVRVSDPTFNPLACDDFESYNTGAMAGQSTDWLPWGGAFGSEDSEVSTDQAHGGAQALKIHDSGTNGVSDIVRNLGDFNGGTHEVSFWFNVPSGNGGNFNLMHFYHPSGTGNTWAIETYLDGSTGTGELTGGSSNTDTISSFSFNAGAWNEAQVIVNLDADSAEFILNGSSVAMWQWSNGQPGVYNNLGAVSFYSADVNGLPALMYVDDFCTGAVNAPCVVTTQPTTADVTVCVATPATLNATPGSGTAFPIWTNSLGTVVGSGSPFTTDTLYTDETFSVQDGELVGPQFHVGPTPDIAATGFGNVDIGMYVTIMNDLRLDSITLRSDGPMVVGVNLWSDDPSDGGVLLQTTAGLTLPAAGDHQVHVDMVIPQGQYFLNMRYDDAANGALFRATAGATFPYVIPDLVSLDSINFANQLRYYYLFDWVVNQVCLNGATVDADVMIDPDPTAAFNFNQTGAGMEVVDFDASGSSSDAVSYDWDFDDGNTGSGANVQHTYTAAGQYVVTLTVTDDCGGTDVTTQTIDVTIGLNEIGLTSINLFPNPTRENFNLSFEVTELQDIDIYVLNAMGQVMHTTSLKGFNGTYSENISLAGEAKGVYMVQIATKDGVLNRRVSLQ